jgi:glycosyltransferase involved in cell wall biosynthesis
VTSGRFVDQKGHIHLVEAMPEIVKNYPEIRFLFLGDGPLEEELQQRIDELGVARQVVFAGMRTDLSLELNGADLMIHPSIAEPFGIAVLEGMRAGIPVVASEVGGIPEVVGDVGAAYLVPPGESDRLAKAVIELAGLPEMRKSMGEAGQKRFAREFRLEIMCDRIETSFLRLLRREEKYGSA